MSGEGRRYTVGLTGGIGSGKSSVGRAFEARGIAVIDADALAHGLTRPGGPAMPAIRAAFGDEFVDAAGAMDRAKMRALVFADPAAKVRLEGILHPIIRAETLRLANAATSPYVILMIPLLIESGVARSRCDRVLVVDCPEDEQVRRVMTRSGLAAEQVRAVMAAQATRAQRLSAADDVLDNGGGPEAIEPQVERLHERYLGLAAKR
jgi:dephospho-CoA kinase